MTFEIPVGLNIPQDTECLPRLTHSLVEATAPSIPLFWFVGAQGGAGTTTLAATMAPAGDAGHYWPEKEKYPVTILTARSTLSGITQLDTHLREAAARKTTCGVIGVLLIADSPQPWPKVVAHTWKSLRPLAEAIGAHMWTLPFISELRDNLPTELAVWEPGDNQDQRKRFSKAPSLTQRPHSAIAALGEEITAYALTYLKENT